MQTEPNSETETAEDVKPSRIRFSLSTMIVTISLSCLVMGNVISAGKWYFETRALKRELAIAERTTGYLVVDDPTKIQVTNVGRFAKGIWQFRLHLPEGHNYRLCHRVGDIPQEGSPEKDPRIHVTELGPGRVHLSFWLERFSENEWKIHRVGTWWHGGHGTMLDTTSHYSGKLDWFDSSRHGFSSQVSYHQERNYNFRYFLIENQRVPDTRISGHRSYDPSERFDLIKIRAKELQAPAKDPKAIPTDKVIKALEANNQIPKVSDGIQMWIEPVPLP